ncbi:MAG: biotin/lipoyl-containing protein, partial [Candidatus Latescibacterota bacterium]
NVLYGRWKKIDAGYGKAVLGYFGKTPLPADSNVIEEASKQLNLPVFDGDPLAAAPKNIEPATKALQERNLPINDKNVFLVLASMVPGKNMELNEGIRLLTGKCKIDIPLKKKEEPKKEIVTAAPAAAHVASSFTGPVTTRCTVMERDISRVFTVTVEPVAGVAGNPGPAAKAASLAPAAAAPITAGTPVYTTFAGTVEVVEIAVKVGDAVKKGQRVAKIEAMKAEHEIKAPVDGTVSAVHVALGDEVDSSKPILTIS